MVDVKDSASEDKSHFIKIKAGKELRQLLTTLMLVLF